MSEREIAELLERTADRHNVGSPPLDQMLTNSRRARKRRARFMAVAASVVIGSLIAGTTWLFNPDDDPGPATGIPHPTKVVPWKAEPGPRPSPDLVAPLAGKPIAVTLNLPGYQRQSTPSSARYKFLVRLSNLGDEPVLLDPCPFYRVQFVKDVETGYLNCNQGPSEIPAAGHVDFEMEAPASDAEYLASSGGNDFDLLWQLGTEGSEGATARGTAHLASPAEPVDLEGQWTLTALVSSDGASVLTDSYANRDRGISFEKGRFEGTAGCNRLFGAYRQAGDNGRDLEFTQVGTTQMACPNESPFGERLRAVRHVSEVNGTLRLHDRYWTIIAVLERDTPTPESTQTSASSQAPPRRLNMQVVRQFGASQQFRAYSGPQPPATSEPEAIRSVQGDEVYSLGLHDIGFVHYSGSIEWHSVWIIASDSFVTDVDRGSRGGIGGGGMAQGPDGTITPIQGSPVETSEPAAGWSRSVTMIDVITGKVVMGLSF